MRAKATSIAHMSGTAFGTVVLHVSPEAEAGGTLAVVQNGDEIELDGQRRRLDVLISEQELKARLQNWQGPQTSKKYKRGYYKLYIDHVLQAEHGCDLYFLVGKSGSKVERESH